MLPCTHYCTHQKFLTWLSVLPGRRFAISDQRFPISALACVIVASSDSVQAPFLMWGSVCTKKSKMQRYKKKKHAKISCCFNLCSKRHHHMNTITTINSVHFTLAMTWVVSCSFFFVRKEYAGFFLNI